MANMKTAIVEEEHQSVAAAAEENDSSSSQQSGGTGGGYAADGSASDDADDNNVSSGSFKLSVECFRQHQHHHDAVSHQDNMQHSHSHHPSRHKRRLMKRSSSPSTIPHITSGTNSRSNNDVAAAAAAAHHWDSVLNNTNIESQDQRQAIEIFLANGATSIDSHIQLMSVSSFTISLELILLSWTLKI